MSEPVAVDDDRSEAQRWRQDLGLNDEDVQVAGKRCAVVWAPWMGDWFVSSSPRNDNSHAEGWWDHWVDLAIKILRDPLTELVRPDAHAVAVRDLPDPMNLYADATRKLTDEELMARFRRDPS